MIWLASDSDTALLLWALGGVFGGFAIFCVCAAIYLHCHREVPSSEGESGERSSQSTTRRSKDWNDPPLIVREWRRLQSWRRAAERAQGDYMRGGHIR